MKTFQCSDLEIWQLAVKMQDTGIVLAVTNQE